MPRNFWLVTVMPQEFPMVLERNFLEQAVGAQHRRRLERMEEGDRVLFYIRIRRLFPATATVTSRSFRDQPSTDEHAPKDGSKMLLLRIELNMDVVLEEQDYIPALEIAPRMEFVRRWAPEDWPLAFQGNYHLIPKLDFNMIEEEMKKVQARRAGRFYRPKVDKARLRR